MFECKVEVKGDGEGRYGRPRYNIVKSVSDLLIDNTVYYKAIRSHVLSCQKCCPSQVLSIYLSRRVSLSKFKGVVSSGLFKLAGSYRSVCKKRGVEFPDGVYREICWRTLDPELVVKYQQDMSVLDCIELVRLYKKNFNNYESSHQFLRLVDKSPFFGVVSQILGDDSLSDDEFIKLVEVAKILEA